MANEGQCVISGFSSHLEREVLHFLMKGRQQIILVLARQMYNDMTAERQDSRNQTPGFWPNWGYMPQNLAKLCRETAAKCSSICAKNLRRQRDMRQIEYLKDDDLVYNNMVIEGADG